MITTLISLNMFIVPVAIAELEYLSACESISLCGYGEAELKRKSVYGPFSGWDNADESRRNEEVERRCAGKEKRRRRLKQEGAAGEMESEGERAKVLISHIRKTI